MKKYTKNIIIFMLIFTLSFLTISNTAIASEHGGGGGSDHGKLTEEEKRLKKLEIVDSIEKYLLFLCSEIGVYFNGSSYSDFYNNYVDYVKSTNDKWFEDNVSVSDDGKAIFSQDLMKSLKEYIDQYAKENEPYTLCETFSLSDISLSLFGERKYIYDTLVNLLNDSSSGIIGYGWYRNQTQTSIVFVDVNKYFKTSSPVFYNNNARLDGNVFWYDNETWNKIGMPAYWVVVPADSNAIVSKDDFISLAGSNYLESDDIYSSLSSASRVYPFTSSMSKNDFFGNVYGTYIPVNKNKHLPLISKETRRIRVFNSYGDFQNYTLGRRKVYYTSNYYNYVPEDLSVSIDDLQKEIDDLSKVIDQLLDQISKDTDENEIEELLRQILEALKNQQGTGGGGSGGGDVNIDLTTTNGLLSKILAKVTQIFDKMSASAGKTLDDVVTSVDDLGRMLKKYLSEITGDLDDIKGQLEQISEQEFTEKTDSFMEENKESFSEITDVAKTKFPFSLLSDIGKLLSVFRSPPPEQAAQAFNMTASYADDGESIFTYGDNELLTVYEGGTGETLQRSDTGAPVFSLPLVITSLGWNYSIVIDMSEFQSIADMMRTLFTLIYIYGMIKFSFPVIELWGVLID